MIHCHELAEDSVKITPKCFLRFQLAEYGVSGPNCPVRIKSWPNYNQPRAEEAMEENDPQNSQTNHTSKHLFRKGK